MKPLLVMVLLGACTSSSYGEPRTPRGDAGAVDAATDHRSNDERCPSALGQIGCAHNIERWLWDGRGCVTAFECAHRGHATENECRRAYARCGAEPPDIECLPIACPAGFTCDDEGRASCDPVPSYVLYRHAKTCSDSDGYALLFGLVPLSDADNVEGGIGELRDLAVPPLSIEIRLFAEGNNLDDIWRIDVGDPRLEVGRCERDGCEFPSDGFLEIETGGAGEVRIELNFVFEGEEVSLAPRWFSINDERDGC